MRLSCACIRVGEHTTRPEMKAPGSEDDVRSKRPYGAERNITKYRRSFLFFLENLNSLHTFLVQKKIRCNANFLQIFLLSSRDKGSCFKDKKACF